MSFDLQLDSTRWRKHLDTVLAEMPQLIPVVKGNGYGFGRERLYAEASRLGADTIGVGTQFEVSEALERFAGDIQVLTPWRSFLPSVDSSRVIHTISRAADLTELADTQPGARVVLELETSMARFGMGADELTKCRDALGSFVLEGVTVHLPLRRSNLAEVRRLIATAIEAGLASDKFFASHLTVAELETLKGDYPDLTIRPRVGTRLWLGDPAAMQAVGTVLETHGVERGERVGYRQEAISRSGTIVIVSGGTGHGIGLEAPRHADSMVDRGKAFARGSLAAAGWTRSPFWIEGRQRLFLEPPHMQVSMLFLPTGCPAPAVGDQVRAAVRWTTTSFDRVIEAEHDAEHQIEAPAD